MTSNSDDTLQKPLMWLSPVPRFFAFRHFFRATYGFHPGFRENLEKSCCQVPLFTWTGTIFQLLMINVKQQS
jgi:hypothetical protein